MRRFFVIIFLGLLMVRGFDTSVSAQICQDRLYNDGCSIPLIWRVVSLGNLEYAMTNFNSACIRHDYCYHHSYYTYGYDRERCDDDFNRDMGAICSKKSALEFPMCANARTVVYDGVRLGGASSFLGDLCNVDGTYCEYEGPGENSLLTDVPLVANMAAQRGALTPYAAAEIGKLLANYFNPDNNYRCGATVSECEANPERKVLLKEDALFYQLLMHVDISKWQLLRNSNSWNGLYCEVGTFYEGYPESSREGPGIRRAERLSGPCGDHIRGGGVCIPDGPDNVLYDDWKYAFWESWNNLVKCSLGLDDDGDGISNACDLCPNYFDPTNQCGFEDATTDILADYSSHQGAAWGDYDNDGDLDLFLKSTNLSPYPIQENKLLKNENCAACHINASTFSFIDSTITVMRNAGDKTCPPVWGDYNNDGLLDLFVGGGKYGQGSKMLRNLGGGDFADASSALPDIIEYCGRGIWVDYNSDGALDLYIVQGLSKGNKLLRNTRSGFVDATNELPLASEDSVWVDIDNDGDPDLCAGSRIFRNEGSSGFIDASGELLGNAPGFRCFGAWGDYDNDGYLDVFVPGEVDAENRTYTNYLYHNKGQEGFEAVDSILYARGPWPNLQNFVAATWGDFDNDGLLDLYAVNDGYSNYPNILFRNLGGGNFADATSELIGVVAYGRDAIWGDYDNDGSLDLYLINDKKSGINIPGDDPLNTGHNRLFRNIVSNGNHWLEVDLVGTVSNSSGIGARVQVTQRWSNEWLTALSNLLPARRSQIRDIMGHAGDSKTAHFGLGPNVGTITVVVRWPSGMIQTLENVSPDTKIKVIEQVPVPGDLDGDGDVDQYDLNKLLSYRNKPASACPSCDLDGDGIITVLDSRKLVLLCTMPRCATQ